MSPQTDPASASDSPGPAITDAGSYRFWSDERVRFADLDPFGHANNNAIGVYFESARVDLFEAANGGKRLGSDGLGVVAARIAIDFRAELHYPARLRIGSRVGHIGRSSIVLESAIFKDDLCVATAEVVMVLVDLTARRPIPVPEELRRCLIGIAGS